MIPIVDVYVMAVYVKQDVEMQRIKVESVKTVAKVSILINAEIPEHLLNDFWEHPADLVINGFGHYFGSGDIHLVRIGGVIVENG